jgi:mono/diheme cytochrome c family protein
MPRRSSIFCTVTTSCEADALRSNVFIELQRSSGLRYARHCVIMRITRAFVFALVISVLVIGCGHSQVPLPATPPTVASTAAADRGEYIVRSVAVCGSCHADPKNPDGPLSGGMPFSNWRIGTARAANLTSDPEMGLGSWSEAEIVRAIRNGQSRSGRLLSPVMPYEWFHEMSDEDAFAVARYLKTLPPVHNAVRQEPNFVFRAAKLFLHPKSGSSPAAPPRGSTPEYGAYLSQHVGLCAECHTPRTGLMQKADRSRLFAGMSHAPKDFPAKPRNLTPDRDTGIGTWSESDFVKTIRTGEDPSGYVLNPFMPWHQLQRMTDDDLLAIYRYLRTLPPIRSDAAANRRP